MAVNDPNEDTSAIQPSDQELVDQPVLETPSQQTSADQPAADRSTPLAPHEVSSQSTNGMTPPPNAVPVYNRERGVWELQQMAEYQGVGPNGDTSRDPMVPRVGTDEVRPVHYESVAQFAQRNAIPVNSVRENNPDALDDDGNITKAELRVRK